MSDKRGYPGTFAGTARPRGPNLGTGLQSNLRSAHYDYLSLLVPAFDSVGRDLVVGRLLPLLQTGLSSNGSSAFGRRLEPNLQLARRSPPVAELLLQHVR